MALEGDERRETEEKDVTSEANAQLRLRANVTRVTGAATATWASSRGTLIPTATRSSSAFAANPAPATTQYRTGRPRTPNVHARLSTKPLAAPSP